jgi:hypothetical protein
VSHDPAPGTPAPPVGEVSIQKAYLGIPDQVNEPIIDARKTYVITVVGVVVFVAVVFLFIL